MFDSDFFILTIGFEFVWLVTISESPTSSLIDLISSSRAEQKTRQAAKKKGVTLKLKLGSLPVKQSDSSIFFNTIDNGAKVDITIPKHYDKWSFSYRW